ncbi:hypothetical protein ACEWY4_022737 [Coilia grayii]|uniref:Fibronectin type-III domain-containing protein n=1 Tax=Coilia grayii TaxID=363190 RepID=A0ABD1J105_9TELE
MIISHYITYIYSSLPVVPRPGPIKFTSVKPDSVCLCWGPPKGLTGPHTFRVSWTGKGRQEKLEVQDLKLQVQELTPGEEYTFTVATLSGEGRQSPCVSATVFTVVPPPEDLTVDVEMDAKSASVAWTNPAGVDKVAYSLNLYAGKTYRSTTKVPSNQHRFSELNIGGEYSIKMFTVLKGRQSKPASITFRMCALAPKGLSVDELDAESADRWRATLRWSLQQGMEQIPHRFLISYCSEGTEPQTISTESCSTTLTGLQPDTLYTVNICTEQTGEKTKTASITFHTSQLHCFIM